MTAPNQPPQALQHQKPAPMALARLPDFNAALDSNSKHLTAALGAMVPVDYFARVARTAMRKQPLLQQSTLESVMGCLMDIAQLRLVPDSVLGEAYMVPFFDKNVGAYIATLMIGYKGLIKMARRNSHVINLHADVVFSNDTFSIQYGSQRHMLHKPCTDGDRGVPIGAYAYMATSIPIEGGGFSSGEDWEYVPKDYIERVKASSKGAEKPESPWNAWPESMWKKTALRQLLKTADLSPDVAEALNKDLDAGSIDVTSSVATGAPIQQSGLIAAATPAQLPPPSEQPANFTPAQQSSGAAQVARQPKPRRTVVTAPAASPVTPSPAPAPAMAATPASAPEPFEPDPSDPAMAYENEAPAALTAPQAPTAFQQPKSEPATDLFS